MELFNAYEAKTRLSELLNRVGEGEEIEIARAGRPVALLVPAGRRRAARVPGAMRRRIHPAADFDETSKDLVETFYGDNDETASWYARPDPVAGRN